jgi:hypothetical protein
MWKYYYSTTSCKKGGKSKQSNAKSKQSIGKSKQSNGKDFNFLLNGKPKDLQLKDYCHELVENL